MVELKQEFEWYLTHQKELLEKHNGKVLLIKDKAVQGVYNTEMEAFNEATLKKYTPGTFLIQRCSPGDKDYSQTFRSRAVFH